MSLLANAVSRRQFFRTTAAVAGATTLLGAEPHLEFPSNPRDRLFAFANVLYDSGICLTSNFQAVVPAELGRQDAVLVTVKAPALNASGPPRPSNVRAAFRISLRVSSPAAVRCPLVAMPHVYS